LFVVHASTTSSVEAFDCFSELPSGSTNLFGRVINYSGIKYPIFSSLFVDPSSATLYLADRDATAVFAWNNANSISGAVTPDRTIVGGNTRLYRPADVFYDPAKDRLYVLDGNNGDLVVVWGSGKTVTGNVAPTAALEMGGTSPNQLFIDTSTDE